MEIDVDPEGQLDDVIAAQLDRLTKAVNTEPAGRLAAVTKEAAVLNVLVSAHSTRQLRLSVDKVSGVMARYEQSAAAREKAMAESQRELARWTFWQGFSTVVLAGFTIAQVLVIACYPR